ncbi:MAG: hypothetical protein BECKG1743D_GA0114223_100712 [Candidatus Kentron sp. G]|nr:MAG: hypothetical protein BECKG1743E_GA0114224_100935 [Candidatus Kentron sp. G]VFM98578.1 MAG: hypothetical protein BECKG1743D_GA0114223_100712 [Candidatus Kentron sp. G]
MVGSRLSTANRRQSTDKAISIKEYTGLLVFIVQLGRCNNSYIVHDAPAARLESQGNRMKVFLVLRNLCIIPKSTLRSQRYEYRFG